MVALLPQRSSMPAGQGPPRPPLPQWGVAEPQPQLLALDGPTADLVTAAIDLLAAEGPTLERPAVDRVKGGTPHNMKELRPGSTARRAVRILFVFDPERKAVLLLAGDKAGRWKDWHRINIPIAERATTSDSVVSEQRRLDVARNWKDVRADAVEDGLTDEGRVAQESKRLTDAVQAQRLADIRKAHALNQKTLADRMHVSQARVSKIEHGALARTELGTLESYVGALGGSLRVVAEFDDQSIALH